MNPQNSSFTTSGAHSSPFAVRFAAIAFTLANVPTRAGVRKFLLNPGSLLKDIQSRLEGDAESGPSVEVQLNRLEVLLAEKTEERARVVGLFRRGRIDELALDEQMAEIGSEESVLKTQVEQLRARSTGADSIRKTIGSAETLLKELRSRFDEPVSWEIKRELIEILVASIRVENVECDGVERSKITVMYRFSEPGDGVEALFEQKYSNGSTDQMPAQPKTIGDHLRLHRLRLKLQQSEAGRRIKASACTIRNWELNRSEPDLRYIPGIIAFLGYNPLPQETTLAGQLVRARTSRGLTQKLAAQEIGVDPSTLARWERGERGPTSERETIVQRFLARDPAIPARIAS
jgi:transcriptional regulator with XRE-family HTH domain